MKHPLVPRIYIKDVSLFWSLMWIASHHPLPDKVRQSFRKVWFCFLRK